MNNWRLLLLAVVAVLQPIDSFTERNVIDGRQECCDHNSDSITPDTHLYGNYRKTTPDERRLSARENIREDKRSEARYDPIIRSKERLIQDNTNRRITDETRFVRYQEHRTRTLTDVREEENRGTRELFSKDYPSERARNVLTSRRYRLSRTVARHIDNERSYGDSRESRITKRMLNFKDLRRDSQNKERMSVLHQERENVVRDSRDSRMISFQPEDRSSSDRQRRLLARNIRDNFRMNARSHISNDDERKELRSRIDSREDRNSDFRASIERGQREQREFRDIRVTEQASHLMSNRENQMKREVTRRRITNKREIEERQQRDRRILSRDRSSQLRDSKLDYDSRNFNRNIRLERFVRNNEQREASIGTQRMSRVRTTNQVLRTVEIEARDERLTRSDESSGERREQFDTRPLVMGTNLDEHNDRESARYRDRNIRDARTARYQSNMRSIEKREHDENRISRDRVQPERNNDLRHQSRRSVSISRLEVNVRPEREFRIRSEETKQRNIHESSRIFLFTEQTIPKERRSRNHGDRRSERYDIRRDISGVNRAPRESDLMKQVRRNLSAPPQRYDSHRMSRNSDFELSRTRSLEENRREIHDRNENEVSRGRNSESLVLRERNREHSREMREMRDHLNTRDKVIRNREDTRTSERYEAHRQQHESRPSDRDTQEHRLRHVSKQAARFNVFSRNDDTRDIDRDVSRSSDSASSRRDSSLSKRMLQMGEATNRATRDVRVEAKRRSSNLVRDADTRRDTIDTRFRELESKVRDMDSIEDTSNNQNLINWQMVFYTLQGAYMCGLLMQLLTENSNKAKSRNFAWWATPKNLIKVD